MEPFEVSVLPSRKPTDGQLAYATDLSISLPPGACFEDVSALISRVVDDDEAPVCEELAVAAYCNGWNLSRYSGTKILLELAAKRLPTEEYKELLNNIKQTEVTPMSKCIKCGAELPEGSAFCAACGTNQTVPQQFTPPSEAELLQRIEQGQQENRRLLKSISSSTAILAVVVIIQVLLAFIGLFT
ncbi:MAG: zinc ribbon domain-containing protein [Ruminococcus sp.]|nr:zinc ribbon domain-containing protein [Ruminiclostridium sp.]MBP1537395.1 zinc ribbon domain-containing protein [Ruminococcus sp.]